MTLSVNRNQLNRRAFVDVSFKSAAGIAIGTSVPGFWMQTVASDLAQQRAENDRILVVIQMSGGNDGLNTVVPYSNELYVKARPKLSVTAEQVLKIDSETGLHPSLRGVSNLLESGRFSIVHGVGYPSPNRSHFESMDIWHSCQRKEARTSDGWLGRLFASESSDKQSDAPGMHLGSEPMPPALVGRGVHVPSIASVEQMRLKSKDNAPDENSASKMEERNESNPSQSTDSDLLGFVSTSTEIALQASQRIDKALATPDSDKFALNSPLWDKLKIVSRLILAGLSTRVYYVTLDGFDTHSNQAEAHSGLLRQWSEAIEAFHARLREAGQQERVLVMTFSEFGRRLAENASQGTDHGAAAPLYLSGPTLQMPQFGKIPALNDLDDGDLKFHTDFRRVYATLIEDWLGHDSEKSLGGKYEKLNGLIRSAS